ncbi:hypothetical protein [Nitrosomonas supralitoralis]|uniref:Uncharacterized protein n=1 Tax=Nitrosomonas supralitoralis TaxID=2116706 RepID=A0A2P7NRQ9_9PROT|nr:hypothetical protein [Nitrosomonas supralitoralis]PSJ16153.1 hypothetical protein C7H79_15060 [Nitrosomonas supralitoralis]
MKTINYLNGIYSVSLNQDEVFMILSGEMPCIVFENDPEIPNDECLWVYYEPKTNDILPPIYPFPCRIISHMRLENQNYVLMLTPDEPDLAIKERIQEFKAGIKRVDEFAGSVALAINKYRSEVPRLCQKKNA